MKELWNAFDATLLATATGMRVATCAGFLSNRRSLAIPFTSCPVAEFFIRQRMTN